MSQSDGKESTKNLEIIKLKPTGDPIYSGRKKSSLGMNVIHEEDYHPHSVNSYIEHNFIRNFSKQKTTNEIIQQFNEFSRQSRKYSLNNIRKVSIQVPS
jgi:hypothetical protein